MTDFSDMLSKAKDMQIKVATEKLRIDRAYQCAAEGSFI